MQTTPLSVVGNRIRIGEALPFNVRDADHTLLLARGQPVRDASHLQALLERGALVDIAELQTARERLDQVPRDELPQRWSSCLNRVSRTLQNAGGEDFRGALDDAVAPVMALVERDPDLAIFQILRQQASDSTAYAVRRSVNTGITAFLVAQRLGWDAGAAQKAFKVALTANVSMLDLQGRLATQRTPPTASQRAELQRHPLRSAELLSLAGIADRDWLQAVERHHEVEDGSGYPRGCTDVGDLATLARRADIYTAKLSARSHREAMSADLAGRQMFMADPGHPMTAALVKEFGVYPPGCFVRLASGAVGIVVERGPTVTTPVVVTLTGEDQRPLPVPRRVDTALPAHRVVAVVGERGINLEVTADRLLELALR